MERMMSRRSALMATAGAGAAIGMPKPPSTGELSRGGGLQTAAVTGTPNFLAPTNDPTGVGDYDNISMNAGNQAWLLPGQYYLSAEVELATAGQQLYGCGPGTVISQGSQYSGSGGLFSPHASSVRLSNFAVNLTSVPFIDFGNVYVSYFEVDHVTVTAGTAGMTGPAADIFTNPNFHRSSFHDLLLIQNSGQNAVFTKGPAGTGLSTSSFERIVTIAGPDGSTGNRSVPAWQVLLPGNMNVDVLRFENCFTLNNIAAGTLDNTQPLMDFACTGDASGVVDDRLVIRSCDFGRALGGAVRIRSYIGIELDYVTVGNVYAQQGKSLARAPINIGTYGSSGTPCRGVEIVSYVREGNGPNGSIYDIQLSSDTSQVTVRTPATTDPASPVSINVNHASGVVIENPGPASILDPASDTVVLGGPHGVSVGGASLTAALTRS